MKKLVKSQKKVLVLRSEKLRALFPVSLEGVVGGTDLGWDPTRSRTAGCRP